MKMISYLDKQDTIVFHLLQTLIGVGKPGRRKKSGPVSEL